MMKLTTENGIPIFIDDDGNTLDYTEGIKRLRKMHKWSARDLAEKCGVSHRTIENWEQGRTPPSKPVLILIQNLLDE